MSVTKRLLRLAAKVALDRLIGSDRTNEALAIFQEWASQRDPARLSQELAEARREAANPVEIDRAIDEEVAQLGQNVSAGQRQAVAFSLSSGFSSLAEANDAATSLKLLAENVLPGKAKTYVVWLDHPAIIEGPRGRYCHFNWDGNAYRVRDFLGGRILHQPGPAVNEVGFEAVPLGMSALEVWNASQGRIQCLIRFPVIPCVRPSSPWAGLGLTGAVTTQIFSGKRINRFGLVVPVTAGDRWRQILSLLTETARLWGPA